MILRYTILNAISNLRLGVVKHACAWMCQQLTHPRTSCSARCIMIRFQHIMLYSAFQQLGPHSCIATVAPHNCHSDSRLTIATLHNHQSLTSLGLLLVKPASAGHRVIGEPTLNPAKMAWSTITGGDVERDLRSRRRLRNPCQADVKCCHKATHSQQCPAFPYYSNHFQLCEHQPLQLPSIAKIHAFS